MENKIEVFILTFNRVEFLKESLNSILAQTVKTQVTVVDNASDDGTCEYMSKMAERFDNVFYVRNEKNLGYNGNLQKAVSLAKKPYVMLFHDDDILHESYIALANRALEKFPDLDLIMSDVRGVLSENINALNWEKPRTEAYFCKDKLALTLFMYAVGKMAYPSVVYKSEYIKEKVFGWDDCIGKIYDKIFVCECMGKGAALSFTDKNLLRYRIHKGQDTNAANDCGYAEKISANYIAYFKNATAKSALAKFLFGVKTHKVLRSLCAMLMPKNYPFRDFARAVDSKCKLPLLTKICDMPIFGGLVYALENAAVFLYRQSAKKVDLK